MEDNYTFNTISSKWTGIFMLIISSGLGSIVDHFTGKQDWWAQSAFQLGAYSHHVLIPLSWQALSSEDSWLVKHTVLGQHCDRLVCWLASSPAFCHFSYSCFMLTRTTEQTVKSSAIWNWAGEKPYCLVLNCDWWTRMETVQKADSYQTVPMCLKCLCPSCQSDMVMLC